MNISKRIPSEIIYAVIGLLTPFCPDISANNLIESIKTYGSKTDNAMQPSLTYKEFAKTAGLSLPTVHRMAKRGDLKVVKIGPKAIRIPYEEVERIINGKNTKAS